jgi:predicted nucleic acid-binding protein
VVTPRQATDPIAHVAVANPNHFNGRLLAELAAREGRATIHSNPSLANDALLAASCREHGFTLVTSDGDFDRFLPSLGRWRHARPWPKVGKTAGPPRPTRQR